MSARSRIRRLRDWRAHDRARKHLSPTMRAMLGFEVLRYRPIIHPSALALLLLLEAREGRPVDRTRRGWNRFPGWTCQLCGRAGHVGPCRKRRNRDTFLKPPKIARAIGRALLKLAKDLPR